MNGHSVIHFIVSDSQNPFLTGIVRHFWGAHIDDTHRSRFERLGARNPYNDRKTM